MAQHHEFQTLNDIASVQRLCIAQSDGEITDSVHPNGLKRFTGPGQQHVDTKALFINHALWNREDLYEVTVNAVFVCGEK